MTSERWQQIKTLLDEALDRPPAARAAFLGERYPDDAVLRSEVRSLLDAYDGATAFFSEGALGEEMRPSARAPLEEGAAVGPYRLIEVLGRGGMGTVYRAARDDAQYEREVALKVIRPGLYTPEVRRRFRAERQILASLEHPNIARLYDGGLTDDGRPYFAMERVDGTPIGRYCDAQQLRVEERLRLFEKVARALAYAHRKLVVHRDLKPSNVLVTPAGEPKLLDFGVAKLLDPDAQADDVPITRTGRALMTPEYAAPEQVRGEEITTATDVYALGVLLYLLLTGRRPYRFEKRTPSHVEAVICETQPARPSTAVTRASEAHADAHAEMAPEDASRARSTRPGRLQRTLEGDLDRIALKALRKEPSRRYATAAELADDLRRHLDGLPVKARPATWRYRAGKFVRRHRWGVAAAAVLTLLLVGYAATVTMQARRIAAERDRAQMEAEKAEQVSGFLTSLFEASDPGVARGDTLTAPELLRRGAERTEKLSNQPEVQAQVQTEIGRVYRSLGQYEQAQDLLERALATRRDVLGDGHPDVAESLHELAILHVRERDYETAEVLFRKALHRYRRALGRDDPAVAESLNDLAVCLRREGRLHAADSLYRRALAIRRATFGDAHPTVAATLNNLAVLAAEQGNLNRADSLYRRVLAMRKERLGDVHPRVANTLNNLAVLLRRKKEYAAADSLYRKALSMRRRLLGPKHPQVAQSLNNRAGLLRERGQPAAAESLYRRALQIRLAAFGEDHIKVANSRHNLAGALRDQDKYEAAEPLYRKALATYEAKLGAQHAYTAVALKSLGDLYDAWGKPEQAAAWRDSLRIAKAASN